MAHAYTPGLRVSAYATIQKQRRLPLKGEVLVASGDRVTRDQVVARTELPGNVSSVNLVNRLGVTPEELPDYLLKQPGDPIAAGEPLAETRPFIKWFKTTVESPVTGTLESVSSVTGQLILREPPRQVEVNAFVDGVVTDLIPEEGVLIETSGAYAQGIFGVGGECWGPLKMLVDRPDENLDAGKIDSACSGRILVGGSLITPEAVARAREVGAVGLLAGGLLDQDLRALLGYDLGVAITGTEQIGLTLIVTEGFGKIAMARKTFDILRSCTGMEASISGATQIRAGVMRPEIIIPATQEDSLAGDGGGTGIQTETDTDNQRGLDIGRTLRAIRAPYFGRIGQVSALPSELRKVESGAQVRVLEVEFEDGSQALIPRANVELIEE